MRVAVISDIHANLHALEAVLAALEDEPHDALWCLGDLVGYGPRPNECCALVRERADLCLVGNHDLVVLGSLSSDDFNPEAAAAAQWTSAELSADSRTFLSTLSPTAEKDGVELFHASARDPVWEYVLTFESALASLELTTAPLLLVGHSHVALALLLDEEGISGGVAAADAEADLSAGRWLLNPGAVGQPRDGDPRAAYLLADLDSRTARFRRVPYSVEETQQEMRERGLPEALAARLAFGQ
jgi:diadenosine tetraphosphatase ApaH/serine/threonine PP2A family protein phosphatase